MKCKMEVNGRVLRNIDLQSDLQRGARRLLTEGGNARRQGGIVVISDFEFFLLASISQDI